MSSSRYSRSNFLGDVDFDDYVVLTNAPDHEYNKLYGLPFEDNVEGSYKIKLLKRCGKTHWRTELVYVEKC